MADFDNYRYYKGESRNPYTGKDFGKAFWWVVESYAFTHGDTKESDKLSKTMTYYLQEHMWEGDGQHNTTRAEFLKRATELYRRGIWSRSYIGLTWYTFQQALSENRSN